MDNYLESLVKKGEAIQSVEEPIKEGTVITEPAAEVTPEEPVKVEAELTAEEKVEPVKEELVKEEIAEPTKKETEPVKEQPKAEPVKENEPVIGYEKDQMISVENIKMFNSADPKGVFKIFTGNIIYKDEINGMYLVEYVKPGLGLVKGFVTDFQ